MSDIRRSTGVSTGSLYHHFPSKEHLAASLFLEGVSDYQTGFLAMLQGASDAQAGVRGGVVFHLRWARQNRSWSRFVLGAMDTDVAAVAGQEAAPRARRFLREVHAWLGEQVRRAVVVELPRELYYPVWIGPAQEFTRQWLAGRMRIAMGDAEACLADLAWRSLQAHALPDRSAD